jgi:hypothetical protein
MITIPLFDRGPSLRPDRDRVERRAERQSRIAAA